jgi:hypothetical protein
MRPNRTYTLRLVYRHSRPHTGFFDTISYVISGSFA